MATPRVKTPKFSGKKEENFLSFARDFESYRTQCGITKANAFPWFRNCLSGQAKKFVDRLLTDDVTLTYETAIDCLKVIYIPEENTTTKVERRLWEVKKKRKESFKTFLLRILSILGDEPLVGHLKELVQQKLLNAVPEQLYFALRQGTIPQTPHELYAKLINLAQGTPKEQKLMKMLQDRHDDSSASSSHSSDDSSSSCDSSSTYGSDSSGNKHRSKKKSKNKKRKKLHREEKRLKLFQEWSKGSGAAEQSKEEAKSKQPSLEHFEQKLAEKFEKLSINFLQNARRDSAEASSQQHQVNHLDEQKNQSAMPQTSNVPGNHRGNYRGNNYRGNNNSNYNGGNYTSNYNSGNYNSNYRGNNNRGNYRGNNYRGNNNNGHRGNYQNDPNYSFAGPPHNFQGNTGHYNNYGYNQATPNEPMYTTLPQLDWPRQPAPLFAIQQAPITEGAQPSRCLICQSIFHSRPQDCPEIKSM